jgi:hypothetical protein
LPTVVVVAKVCPLSANVTFEREGVRSGQSQVHTLKSRINMKSFFISAGLVAVGAAGLQSALADDSVTAASPKIWSVSATLRGFYDSNYATSPNTKGSYGIELSPSVALNDSLQQTDIGVRYTYGLYWYQERQILSQNAIDQTHQLDLWLDHAFDERWKLNFSDTFASGQEPELLTGSGVPFRVNGDNIANHFNVSLDTQWTRELSTSLHYENDFYDFQNSGASLVGGAIVNGPSLAGLLNRDEQIGGLDLQWRFDPETMVFVGYSFDWVDYMGQEPIAVSPIYGPQFSDSRNYFSHQIYAGVQHQFTANLGGSVKAGAQYVDSYNDPAPDSQNWSPYANVALTYTYLPGSYIQAGFSQTDVSTYVASLGSNGGLTQYTEDSTVYASINHHFTEKLIGSAIGQYSYNEFHGGEGFAPDVTYSAGLNLTYIINQYLSTDIGYNYDRLRSDVPGSAYERNRWYIGLTATY